jgi:uncharacterized protein
MKLLGITDLHGKRHLLERILQDAGPADVILLGGDITNFGGPSDAEKLIRAAQASQTTIFAVAGNCDSAEIEQRLIDLGVSLFRRGVVHQEVGFHGLSAMPPWLAGMYHFTEDELADALQAGYAQVAGAQRHVILSHPPPRNQHLDRTHWGNHVGCTSLRAFIEQRQPDLVFCGHIHEGRGVEMIGRTTVVNCGAAAAGFYALAELGDQVAVELRKA